MYLYDTFHRKDKAPHRGHLKTKHNSENSAQTRAMVTQFVKLVTIGQIGTICRIGKRLVTQLVQRMLKERERKQKTKKKSTC